MGGIFSGTGTAGLGGGIGIGSGLGNGGNPYSEGLSTAGGGGRGGLLLGTDGGGVVGRGGNPSGLVISGSSLSSAGNPSPGLFFFFPQNFSGMLFF